MNKKLNLSSLKSNINSVAVIGVVMVILVIILGVATWFTVNNCIKTKEKIQTLNSEYNANKSLIGNLENIKNNTVAFQTEQEKINKKIADVNDYDEKSYFIEIYNMCEEYNLEISDANGGIEVEEMISDGSGVYTAKTSVAVMGDELNVRKMIENITSAENVTRVDDIAMTAQEDGSVVAVFIITNIAK